MCPTGLRCVAEVCGGDHAGSSLHSKTFVGGGAIVVASPALGAVLLRVQIEKRAWDASSPNRGRVRISHTDGRMDETFVRMKSSYGTPAPNADWTAPVPNK